MKCFSFQAELKLFKLESQCRGLPNRYGFPKCIAVSIPAFNNRKSTMNQLLVLQCPVLASAACLLKSREVQWRLPKLQILPLLTVPSPPFFCSILKSVEPAPFPFDMGGWMWEHLFAGFFSALCLGSSYSRTDFLVKCATKSFTFRVHSVRGRLQRFLLYQHLVKDEDFYYIQKGNLAILWVFRFLHWEGTRCWGVVLWPVSSSVNLSWFGAEGHKDHLQVGFKSSNGYLCPKGFMQFINLYWAF